MTALVLDAAAIARHGAELHTGGRRRDDLGPGYFFEPTAVLAPDRVERLVLIDSDGYQPSVLSMPIAFQVASSRWLRWVSERILPRPLMAASLRSVFGEPSEKCSISKTRS